MLRHLIIFVTLTIATTAQAAPSWVSSSKQENGFPIASRGKAASIHFSDEDATVVSIAASHLAHDIHSVSGRKAQINTLSNRANIYIGTLGQSPLIKSLDLARHLDLGQLEGQWESFIISTFPDSNSASGIALAIIGSDRRGTAFGVYELAEAMGVSPWTWWADVPPHKSSEIWIEAGTQRFGPPSVKYRGIFINDEDWGLHPWAKYTFDPELGDIGPKTYEKVFELMLRLKANTIWPAMHEVTKAFNLYPENKTLADDYAIVMGSSHAEPMLRNNVTEWTAPKTHFNFATHPEEVTEYWDQRVVENGKFENIYTLGMRGIHDSGMRGASTMQDKVDALSRIFDAQRSVLAKRVTSDLETVPQAFTPYKEVLDIYRAGLDVPDEVILVWPDDNHGYIRYLPDEAERLRSGGSGVYYHISYLGSPLAYLWLSTTPPALIWAEMNKAYELGAQEMWILNVGDIKPSEKETDFFLQMAWDIDRWNLDTLPKFLETWAARDFGAEFAKPIADILSGFYQLNYQRRPEHLQWWLPHTRVRSSTLNGPEAKSRIEAFAQLIIDTEDLAEKIPAAAQDAFFQLVAYPVKASAFANLRYFHNEQSSRYFNADQAGSFAHAARARYADDQVNALTSYYNHELADGKWNRMMAAEPADSMWRSYRLMPLPLPAENMSEGKLSNPFKLEGLPFGPPARGPAYTQIEAEDFTTKSDSPEARWETVADLGRSGDSVTAFPFNASTMPVGSASPYLEYEFEIEESGEYFIQAEALPTFPLNGQKELRLAFSVNGSEPVIASVARSVNDAAWKQAVLSAHVSLTTEESYQLNSGLHTLRIHFVDPGVVIDQLFILQESPRTTLLGPNPFGEG